MHVLHHIAVEADSAEEANNIVQALLDDGFFAWSDWSTIGGSRFEARTINYAENEKEFLARLARSRHNRATEVAEMLEGLDISKVIEELQNYNGQNELGFDHWRLKNAFRIATGSSVSGAYFFDTVEYCTSDEYLIKRLEIEPKTQYLVPVDFHF